MSNAPVLRRIAVFLSSYRGGGAERAMLLFARELVDRGIAVDLLVVQADGPLAPLVPKAAVVIDLNKRGVLAALPSLVRYLRRARPDALYTSMAHSNVVALLAARLGGAHLRTVVREAVGPLSADTSFSLSARVVRGLVPLVYPWAHAVICVSHDVAEELCRISERIRPKISVLPTPVVSDALLRNGDQPLHHPWFVSGAPPVVLGAGRLHPQKDFATLLRAFASLHRTRPLRLIVLGEGEERTALEALSRELGVASDVQLPGFVDNPFPYLKRAAVFVLSSRYEGMPSALLQAMAFGTPVVSTDCPGGSRDVLQHGRLGALVPPGDVQKLATGISSALGSGRRIDAAKHVYETFGVTRAADAYLKVLQPC